MASEAKEKAYALKNSYVDGLIEGGATAPAPAQANPSQGSGGFDTENLAGKMGMNTGDQASVTVNLDRGRTTFKNDGDSTIYIKERGETARRDSGRRGRPMSNSEIANPVPSNMGRSRVDVPNNAVRQNQPELIYYAEDEMDGHRAHGREQADRKRRSQQAVANFQNAYRNSQPKTYNVQPNFGGGYTVRQTNQYGF